MLTLQKRLLSTAVGIYDAQSMRCIMMVMLLLLLLRMMMTIVRAINLLTDS